MKRIVLALPFILASATAWADEICLPTRMSLDDERRNDSREPQDVELDHQRPDDTARLTPMEFVFRHSELEGGMLYTDFDSGLGLRSHIGFYLRYGVEIAPHLSVQMTYRFSTFGNGPAATTPEDVRIQTLLLGASYHLPLTPEFAVVGGVGIGPTWWDSTLVHNDIAFTICGELGITAQIWQMLRLKAGVVLDGCDTRFHQASGMSVDVSGLFGFEYGL